MKKINKICILLMLLLGLFTTSFADVGNFESYDSDWGSDSSFDFDSDYDFDYDSDYDYDSGYYDESIDEDTSLGAGIIIIIIIIIIICSNSRSKEHSVVQTTNIPIKKDPSQITNLNVLVQIKAVDEFFNEANFLSWAKNLFVKLQTAWTARDWEVIRAFETEELFEQHSNQLKQYINNKQINVMDRIAVNYAKLYSFSQDNDKDTLSIVLNASMLDYIIDEETKNVLQGNKTTRRTNTYMMTFIRKKGVKTSESTEKLESKNCPNCGAPTTITSSGKCEYCGSVITTGDHDWVLSNLEPYRR